MMASAQPATPNGFPSELDDREWLAARYQSLGDDTIASELRVSLKAIRRARERLGIEGPVDRVYGPAHDPSANGAATARTNGASGANGASPAGTNGAAAGGGFVSDEELTQRIGRVKKGLADTCARLVTAINELEWVRQQVAPPDRTPSRPHA
jgi:hypothetical protein